MNILLSIKVIRLGKLIPLGEKVEDKLLDLEELMKTKEMPQDLKKESRED